MEKKVTVCPEGRDSFEADLVMAFEIVETGSKYVIYTKNEVVDTSLVKLYVAALKTENGVEMARQIEDGDEWNKVKEIMKAIINGG